LCSISFIHVLSRWHADKADFQTRITTDFFNPYKSALRSISIICVLSRWHADKADFQTQITTDFFNPLKSALRSISFIHVLSRWHADKADFQTRITTDFFNLYKSALRSISVICVPLPFPLRISSSILISRCKRQSPVPTGQRFVSLIWKTFFQSKLLISRRPCPASGCLCLRLSFFC